MCFGFGTISNTTINADGHSVQFYSNSLSPFGSCNSFSSFSPGFFGYGFNSMCGNDSSSFSAGAGLGMAAGMMLPKICSGISKGVSFLWNKIFHKD